MNDQDISAFAREYAEFTDMSPVNKKNISAICECFLKYTLRRYCIVEKEKLQAIRFRKVYSADDVRSKFTEECLIDALFPEIGNVKGNEGQEILTCEKRKVLYHFRLAEAWAEGNHPESEYWIGYSKAIQELFDLKGEPYVEPAVATVISAWVARDEDNDLFIYKRRPVREDGQPFSDKSIWTGGTMFQLDPSSFPNLTWESEPQKVEIIITSKHL